MHTPSPYAAPKGYKMTTVKEKAYAKINLYLDVVNKRPDGFHDIKTVMHTVSLCDDITVIYAPGNKKNIKVMIDGTRFLPADSRNLVYRAADLFLTRAGINADVTVKLTKRIPIAAGLAGGSSDAAATLRALNRITGGYFTSAALSELALELGSDVPYCLIGKTALCEGRGELITRLKDSMLGYFVIAVSDEHISTPMAYSALDEIFSNFDGTVPTGGESFYEDLEGALKSGIVTNKALFNVFERPMLEACPGASYIKEKLLSLSASAALMSGSGPSVFGIFSTLEEANAASSVLLAEGITAFVATSV